MFAVTEFPIEQDHPPTLENVRKFIEALVCGIGTVWHTNPTTKAKWLDGDPLHVVCVHCDRTKVVLLQYIVLSS